MIFSSKEIEHFFENREKYIGKLFKTSNNQFGIILKIEARETSMKEALCSHFLNVTYLFKETIGRGIFLISNPLDNLHLID